MIGLFLLVAGLGMFYVTVPLFERFGLTPATAGGRCMGVIAAAIASLFVSGLVVLSKSLPL